jgi:hypothetical protein
MIRPLSRTAASAGKGCNGRGTAGGIDGKELLGFEVEELNQSLNLCALGEGENILYVDAQIANVLSIFLWPSTI